MSKADWSKVEVFGGEVQEVETSEDPMEADRLIIVNPQGEVLVSINMETLYDELRAYFGDLH